MTVVPLLLSMFIFFSNNLMRRKECMEYANEAAFNDTKQSFDDGLFFVVVVFNFTK